MGQAYRTNPHDCLEMKRIIIRWGLSSLEGEPGLVRVIA